MQGPRNSVREVIANPRVEPPGLSLVATGETPEGRRLTHKSFGLCSSGDDHELFPQSAGLAFAQGCSVGESNA